MFASLLTDTYPIQGRGRVFALYWMAQPIGLLFGPFVAGAIADLAGGAEGWRWTYIDPIAAVLVVLAITASVFLRDPARGPLRAGTRARRAARAGEPPSRSCRSSMSTAYQRMKKIKTFYFICTGIGVLGFALVAVPVQLGLLLEDSYGYGAYTRGWMLSLTAIASLDRDPDRRATLYDRLFRKDPERVVRLAGIVHHRCYGMLHVRRRCA